VNVTATDTTKERSSTWRVQCLLAAALIVAYVVFLVWMSPATFPIATVFHGHMPYLADKPVGEDGFYMLTVADYIATQGKIRYNRGIEATGIQPLSTVVFAGVDWLVHRLHGDEWDFVRGVMLLGAVLFVLFALQIGRIAASLAPTQLADLVFTLAFLLVLTDYTLFRLFTYGLETGVYLCCIALCFASIERIAKAGTTSNSEVVRLGIAAGLAGVARIDFGLLFAILMVLVLAKRWICLVKAIACGAIALIIVSPWFWFLYRVTGSWVPSSGKAESMLITRAVAGVRLSKILVMAAAHIAPWSYGGMSGITTAVALVSVALLVWLFFSAPGRRARQASPLAFQLASLWLPGILALIAVYTVFFSSIQFYHRYESPLVIVTIPLLALLLAQLRWIQLHLVAVEAALFCLFAAWTVGGLHSGHVGNTQAIAAGYVRQYYPSAHVGAFQSGALGYFNRNVENLDGKLNMPAWTAAQQHRLPQFIDHEGIDVLVDWPSAIDQSLPQSYLQSEWQPCPVPLTGTESICLIRK
jgi:hypothetical protein